MEKQTEEQVLEQAILAAGKSSEELLKEAQTRGLDVDVTATQEQLAQKIAEATADEEAPVAEPVPGIRLSLASTDQKTANMFQKIRNQIQLNKMAGKFKKLFLANQKGGFYTKEVPAVPVKRMELLDELIRAVPDGSQDEMLEDFRAHPEKFQQPLLFLRSMKDRNTNQWNSYVMLYIEYKQDFEEQEF